MNPFQPAAAGTVNIVVSSSSQRIALGGRSPQQVRVMNNGTATVWINFGDVTVTAAVATGVPVGPGVTEVLGHGDFASAPYVAAIAAGATGTIYFTPGCGF